MMRRGLVLLGVFAALALSACQTVDWEEQYNESQGLLIDATQERDEALMREEQLRGQVAQLTREYNAMKGQAQADPAELASLRQRLDEAIARVQQAESAAATAAASARSHAAEANRLNQELAEAQARASSVGTENEALMQEVARLVASGRDAHLTADGNIEIRLPSDVTFASGEATLTKSGQASVRSLRDTLNGEYGRFNIRVEGHTDDQPLARTKPKWGDNFGLASARALSVLRFMESDMGIEPARLESASRGQYVPIAAGSSKADRAKNRRVNIVVVIPRSEALAMAK
jgi:chemotaxis protein MotB